MSVLGELRRKIRSFFIFRRKQHISTNSFRYNKVKLKATTLTVI